MSATRTMGIAVTDVSTPQKLPLGFEYHDPASSDDQGEKVWVYIQATGALAEGEIVMRAASTVECKGLVTTGFMAAHRLLGVAQHTIAINSFGFILKRGIGEVAAFDTGNDQDDNPLTCDAGGRADVMADGNEEGVFAHATESAAATAGALFTCWINCPG